MDWHETVFELIDLRSFSNLWYWLAVAVFWSTASHWTLGIPYDLVQRANRHGGQAETDLEDLVRINLNRIFYVVDNSGVWLVAFVAGLLSTLVTLGFFYGYEFAQAVFFLVLPMSLIGLLNIYTGGVIRKTEARGRQLRRILAHHRLATQITGVISIFITGMFGMAQNMLVVGW